MRGLRLKETPESMLLSVLRPGIKVIKHGRHGQPHKTVLTCNEDLSVLYWHTHKKKKSHERFIKLRDVTSIRMGTEIDPTSSTEAIEAFDDIGDVDQVSCT